MAATGSSCARAAGDMTDRVVIFAAIVGYLLLAAGVFLIVAVVTALVILAMGDR